jgi:LmbE family N-acetylglucosaminyl deacetylase
MNLDNKRLLIIAPHPDDEVIAAGGLMARVKAEGGDVFLLVMATGTQQQYGSSSEADVRKSELEEAARILAVDDYALGFDDVHHLKLDLLPQKDIVDLIEKDSAVSISKVRPDILVFPGSSYSQDHQAVYRACVAATRPYPTSLKHTPNVILVYSHFDEEFWNTDITSRRNNFWVDISGYVGVKEQALNCYRSQLKQAQNHWRTVENILLIDQMKGKRAGIRAAEEFCCIRYLI